MNTRRYLKSDKRFPTSTLCQMRIPIYLPLNQARKSNEQRAWVYTSRYGDVTFKNGRLTQEHRNIVDVIFSYYKPTAIHDDGTVEFKFTLYELQKDLQKKSTSNHTWIKKKLDELQGIQLIIEPQKDRLKCSFTKVTCSVLNDHAVSDEADDTGQNGQPLYTVSFNKYYMRLFEQDMQVHTELLTGSIIGLKHSACQALVRYCLSHERVNMRLSKLLINIGVSADSMSKQGISRVKQGILVHAQILKEQFGIDISANNRRDPLVTYKKHKKIWFKGVLGSH